MAVGLLLLVVKEKVDDFEVKSAFEKVSSADRRAL
jgi:hypothetical protein